MLPALLPQPWETGGRPGLVAQLATQVAGRRFVHHLLRNARPSLHTRSAPHTHTQGHTAVPVLVFMAPSVNAPCTLSLLLSLFDLEAEHLQSLN